MTIIKKTKEKPSKKARERYQNLYEELKKASIWCFFLFFKLELEIAPAYCIFQYLNRIIFSFQKLLLQSILKYFVTEVSLS